MMTSRSLQMLMFFVTPSIAFSGWTVDDPDTNEQIPANECIYTGGEVGTESLLFIRLYRSTNELVAVLYDDDISVVNGEWGANFCLPPAEPGMEEEWEIGVYRVDLYYEDPILGAVLWEQGNSFSIVAP